MLSDLKNLADLKKQGLIDLKEECRQEAYEYYDENIEELPRKEGGSLDDMSKLINRLHKVFRSKIMELSFELQFYNEAYHAFVKDEWYEEYYKNTVKSL